MQTEQSKFYEDLFRKTREDLVCDRKMAAIMLQIHAEKDTIVEGYMRKLIAINRQIEIIKR